MQFGFFCEIIVDIPDYMKRPSLRHFGLAHEMDKFLEFATPEELQQFVQFCEDLAVNVELSEDDLVVVQEIKAFVEENVSASHDELEVIAERSMEEELAGDKSFEITSRLLGPTTNERILELRRESQAR